MKSNIAIHTGHNKFRRQFPSSGILMRRKYMKKRRELQALAALEEKLATTNRDLVEMFVVSGGPSVKRSQMRPAQVEYALTILGRAPHNEAPWNYIRAFFGTSTAAAESPPRGSSSADFRTGWAHARTLP